MPCAVTAEIMFRLCRAPVVFTTGVRADRGPRWCRRGGRERIPASSAKYTVAPSFLACLAMAGYSVSFQAAHLRLVGLPRPPQRPLRGQAEPVQQPAHRRGRHRHAELAADQLPDHVPGPQREVELPTAEGPYR